MVDRDGWRERVREICASSVAHEDDDDDDDDDATNISNLNASLVNLFNKLIQKLKWNNKTVTEIRHYTKAISHAVSISWFTDCKHKLERHSTQAASQTITVCCLSKQIHW